MDHELVTRITRALDATDQKWLLCVDGADAEEMVQRLGTHFFPAWRKFGGHVIVTSRVLSCNLWLPLGITQPLELEFLLPTDSTVLLLRMARFAVSTTRQEVSRLQNELPEDETEALKMIVRTASELGGVLFWFGFF